jgi:hypothetical protein
VQGETGAQSTTYAVCAKVCVFITARPSTKRQANFLGS